MNTPHRTNGTEVADVFRCYGPAYRSTHKLPLHILKAMRAIESCRTAALGGHVERCDTCDHIRISYNSCRNRHCPKCQSLAKERWLAARKKELLPVPYFHVVLTIPEELNPLVLVNQKALYTILFRAGSETLLELGNDPKHLGAEVGLIAILHTWGQNLIDHPHLHVVMPCGGLSHEGKAWLLPKKSSGKKEFFVHVNVISDLFKKKFLDYLKESYRKGALKFVGKVEYLQAGQEFQAFSNTLYHRKWITYCKRPFGGPEQVLEYLGRYTHRVAISNDRIVKVDDGTVTFRYRDYRDGNQGKQMTLETFEFIRRFLLHILPDNFVKIRYYGLFNNRNRKAKIRLCKEVLGASAGDEQEPAVPESWEELFTRLTGIDPRICPCCGKGMMVRRETLLPLIHSPPGKG